MQLNAIKNSEFSSNLPTKEFTMEMNPMAFYSVINGIYADKVRAPMRELATNARDGHALAGKLDVPFDIHLPTKFSPVFSVRDYGCSMTHDEIMGLYTTMFASSKRDTNAAVGMIGLGSKSPFAYTSTFTVTTWLGGIKSVYSAAIGSNDVPQIALMNSEPSEEPQGVEVSFPVKMEDVDTFRNAANEVFFGFDPKPNIKGFTFPTYNVAHKGNGYTLYNTGQPGFPFKTAMARQGCVIYPLSSSALGPRFKNNPIFTMPIIIDWPIGQLSVNTSREALGYDSKTVDNIEARMTEVLSDLTQFVQKEIDECKSYLDACDLFCIKRSTNIIYRILGGTLKYRNGPLIKYEFKTNTLGPNYRFRFYPKHHRWVGKVNQTLVFSQIKNSSSLNYLPSELRESVVLVELPNIKENVARARRAFSTFSENVFWLKVENQKTADDFLDSLGNPKTFYLSSFEPLAPPLKISSTGDKMNQFRVFNVLGPDKLTPEFVDITEEQEMVFLMNDGQRIKYNFPYGHSSNYRPVMYDDVEYLKNTFGMKDTTVYCLNNASYERAKKIKTLTLVPFKDALRPFIEKKFGDLNDLIVYIKSIEISSSHSSMSYRPYEMEQLCRKILHSEAKMKIPSDLIELAKIVIPNKSNPIVVNEKEEFAKNKKFTFKKFFEVEYGNRNLVGVPIKKESISDPTIMYNILKKKYPLLDVCYTTDTRFNHYMELITK